VACATWSTIAFGVPVGARSKQADESWRDEIGKPLLKQVREARPMRVIEAKPVEAPQVDRSVTQNHSLMATRVGSEGSEKEAPALIIMCRGKHG